MPKNGSAAKAVLNALDSPKVRAFLWLFIVSVIAVFLLIAVPKAEVSSDVMELLPEETYRAVPKSVTNGLADKMSRQMLFAVTGGEGAAELYFEKLKAIPEFRRLAGRLSDVRRRESASFLFKNRAAFLSYDTRSRLKEGEDAEAEWVLSQLYSPVAGVSAPEIKNDPLLLMRGSTLFDSGTSRMSTSGGWLTATDDKGVTWRFISGEVKKGTASAGSVGPFLDKVKAAQKAVKDAYPNVRFASEGSIFYSGFAGDSAKNDISTLGTVSAILLFIVLGIAYRSPLPFFLALLSVAVGAAAGTAATLLTFGGIHMVTLVMSLSLIGISTDYTTHFLTARMTAKEGVSTFNTLQTLSPTMLQALGTTCLAYAALLIAPFPGLRQLGVFSIAGLAASCATVFAWYPFLSKRFRRKPLIGRNFLRRYIAVWGGRNRYPAILFACLAVFAAGGLMLAGTNDDIGALQTVPSHLKADEDLIRTLTGNDMTQRWFVVTGSSPEEALQRKDALGEKLAALKEEGLITGATLIPLNSRATQQSDWELIKKASPAVLAKLRESGIAAKPESENPTLPFAVWIRDSVSSNWGRLVLGGGGGVGETSLMIPVQGDRSAKADAALQKAASSVPGTVWVDRRADLNHLFSGVRTMIEALLAASLALIFAIYAWRYGLKRAAGIIVPCILSVACGIASLGWAGLPVNIFSLFALVLVLGIGIDYSLFFGNFQKEADSTLFAVFTAMVTTMISLGILVFSGTAAISNFGLVLAAGVFTAFLASPLILRLDWKEESV